MFTQGVTPTGCCRVLRVLRRRASLNPTSHGRLTSFAHLGSPDRRESARVELVREQRAIEGEQRAIEKEMDWENGSSPARHRRRGSRLELRIRGHRAGSRSGRGREAARHRPGEGRRHGADRGRRRRCNVGRGAPRERDGRRGLRKWGNYLGRPCCE